MPDDIIGPVKPPPGISKWIGMGGQGVPGLIPFLNAIIKLLIVGAGLYAFLNLILAGYQFMSAGGEPKSVEKAWAKIWQSLVGLLIIAGSFVLAAIFGWLLFGDATAILKPKIWGPGLEEPWKRPPGPL
ncbi:MAG: hypothetical protein ACOZBZ_00920 [Patescibacteria group bacterium]